MLPAHPPYPSRVVAWSGCILLTITCVVAYVDRMIINLLIIPIQQDLKISDTQVSLLVGLAFSLANAIMALPLARWVDSGNRRNITALGIGVWSAMTAICGMATSMTGMFLARVGVGGSESALPPAATSMLADYFPPNQRSTAIGVLYGGIFIGGGGAYVLGGYMLGLFGPGLTDVPLLGALPAWRLIFLSIGVAGFALIPFVFLIREPVRRNGAQLAAPQSIPVRDVLVFVRSRGRALGGVVAGFTMLGFVVHAGNAWLPTMMVRTHGWTLSETGATLGSLLITLGPLGSLAGGLLSDHLARRGHPDSHILVTIGAACMCALVVPAIIFSTDTAHTMAALGAFYFFGSFSFGLAPSALIGIVPNAMRGQITAGYFLITNILGGSLAALSVALLTDYLFQDPAKVGMAFGIVAELGALGCLAFLWATRAHYRSAFLKMGLASAPAEQVP